MLAFNKVFKLKASGHACGVIGPVLMMAYFKLYIPAAVCALFAIPVFIAGVHTKKAYYDAITRWGVIPLVMLVLVHFIMGC